MSRGAPVEAVLGVLDDIIDERVGVVRHVELVPRDAGDPDFFHVAARACNTAAFCRQQNFANTGGAAADLAIATAKAVGEAVERYAAAIYDHEELPVRSYRDAPFPCAAPGQFALYSAEQYAEPDFPWVPFDEDTEVRWAPGTDMATGQPCHVPAAMVFMPYHYYQDSGEAAIVQPISTGLACHMSQARAELSAICEVIERDAFTITWQAGLARPQLRVETLSDANYDLAERFERTGGLVTLLDITTDVGVPTILAVLQHEAEHCTALVVAAAADPDPEEAVRKSLEELAHTRRYSQQVKARLPRLSRDNLAEIVDQVDHLNFWCDHANASLASFLFRSSTRRDFDDLPNLSTGSAEGDRQVLVERIGALGHRVVACDLTTPDVAGLGFHVTRAVVPGFHPLFMGHRIRALGGRRLRDVPARLGGPTLLTATGDTGLPHPYP
ncbi:MAG TPA: YcaO-like family protein [Acetobacteraceae bacterium]